jgi:Spy/CpxP family protein refolding chaperone
MKHTLFRTTLSSLFLASALAMAGCSGNAQEVQPPATQAQATVAPVAANAHGQVKFIGDALSQVPLRPEQRSEIEKLAADAETRHETGRKAHEDLAKTIADQVERGSIDRAALQPKIDAAVSAAEQSRPQDQAAFQRLHDILDAGQREQFANAMKDKMHAEHGKWGHHDKDAKEGTEAAGPAAEHHGPPMAHMKQLAEDLKLTDDQRSQIKDILRAEFTKNGGKGMHEMMKHRENTADMLEQFKGDQFDMTKAAPQVDLKAKVTEASGKMIDVAEKILPILTPEQRVLAAQKIREHATSGKMPF